MANGGVIGPVGVNMAALAAKKACSPICGSSCRDSSREPENLTYCFYICQTAMSTLSSQSGGITKRAEISI
ncbi:hypothetical protein YC2023_029839 [Brassica napus]